MPIDEAEGCFLSEPPTKIEILQPLTAGIEIEMGFFVCFLPHNFIEFSFNSHSKPPRVTFLVPVVISDAVTVPKRINAGAPALK